MEITDIIYVKESGKNYSDLKGYFLTLSDYITGPLMESMKEPKQLKAAIDEIMNTKKHEKPMEITSQRASFFTKDNAFYRATFLHSKSDVYEVLDYYRTGSQQDIPVSFLEERCSKEIIEMLRMKENILVNPSDGAPHYLYAPAPKPFNPGQTVHNLNGNDYLIVKKLDSDTYMLSSMSDHSIVVAHGMCMYRKFPEDHPEYVIEGVEWQHGDYYGNDLTVIDFQEIMGKYNRDMDREEEIDEPVPIR